MASKESTQSPCSSTTHPASTPLLSILNVVVDHVMMQPCPLEPDEFQMTHPQYDCTDAVTEASGAVKEGISSNAKHDAVSSKHGHDDAHVKFDAADTLGRSFSDYFPDTHGPAANHTDAHAKPASESSSRILVPVLRIFGPVLRNGDDLRYHRSTQDDAKAASCSTHANNDSYSQQPQSGCLHIHGAFPYLLARPVIAGPDGSMHLGHCRRSPTQQSHNDDDAFSPLHGSLGTASANSSAVVDWDNAQSVSNVVEEVHQQLEAALRASLENSPDHLPSKNNPQALHSQRPQLTSSAMYIRSVTVVTGRGFYTYCSGPPAPFLRVEYYDPSLRWRVKLILERGLELSTVYHPDPRVYDYEFDEEELLLEMTHGSNGGGNREEDVRSLKFRCYEAHIPYTMQVFKDYNLAGLKYVNVGHVRFRGPLPRGLRKRTKEDFLRLRTAGENGAGQKDNNHAFFLSDNVPNEWLWHKSDDDGLYNPSLQKRKHWLKKQTSCDLEFDTTVQNILNVNDVMTDLPSRLEERQKIHWRAVPSLREIWEQERKRMGILLSPEKDFLSLEEKELKENEDNSSCSSNSDSGGDEENIYIQKEEVIPQFTLNVKKDASVPGTRLAVKGIKQLFRTSDGLEDDFRRALKDIVSRHDEFLNNVDQQIATNGLMRQNDGTPSLEEGIEALAALGDQFTQNSGANDEEAMFSGSPSSEMISDGLYSTPRNSTPRTLKPYTMTQLTQEEIDEEREMLNFGASVDNESIIELYGEGHAKNTIGPSILDPHDDYDDTFQNEDDFLREEEELGEEGLERTLTFLASQAAEAAEPQGPLVEYEEDTHGEVHHYHSQFCYDSIEGNLSDDHSLDGLGDESSKLVIEEVWSEKKSTKGDFSLTRDEFVEVPFGGSKQCVEGHSSSSTEKVAEKESTKGSFTLTRDEFAEMPFRGSKQCVEGHSRNSTEMVAALPKQLIFRPKHSLRRGELTLQCVAWHPLPDIALNSCPTWFKFQWRDSDSQPPVYCDSFLEPVKRAPSYKWVKSWLKNNKTAFQHKTTQRKETNVCIGREMVREVNATNSTYETSKNNADSSDRIPNHEEGEQGPSKSNCSQTSYTQFSQTPDELKKPDPLSGLGQQGCRVQVSGGGGLKTSIHTPSTFTPMTIMSIEVHVQCRIKTGMKGLREIAMVPDSTRDAVFAVVFVFARDPGGGENIEVLEKGSVLVSIEPRQADENRVSATTVSKYTLGLSSSVTNEIVNSEKSLLLRIASIVQLKDPDILVSWDTQGLGIGYLVERGIALGKSVDGSEDTASSSNEKKVDIARLLGRTPKGASTVDSNRKTGINEEFSLHVDGSDGKDDDYIWAGSGLGAEWDDRVGAGAAAASIAGRIVICGWKICSEECKHPNASYQPAIVSAVLNKRIPYHDDLLLTRWYSMNSGLDRWRVIEYRLTQAMSNILLLDALDVLGRAGEAARLSGVEFSQSLPGIRGSQYKVEGVLLRALQSVRSNERGEKKGLNNSKVAGWQGTALTSSLSARTESQSQSQSPWKRRRLGKLIQQPTFSPNKDLGYFFYSPSKDDCSKQEALECQALTLEPMSGFHFDPVVVCDFTALYPSLVIAYNLCYSTVAGKLDYHSTRKEMMSSGKTTSRIGPFHYSELRTAAVIKHHMKSLNASSSIIPTRKKRDRAYVVPTGSLFVSESVLKGVLPQVLDEMLSTRAMLKKAAKEYKKQVPSLSPAILRQIEARQLALKYVANVTYGYTSATFSGRSAAPLVADAIVECGRRTLTNAINLANRWGKATNGKWHGAHVLYGDTDSIFIKLPGRSVKEAFAFGEEYCKAVTASNPPPVQLKLEKVYAGSLLQTKKKYCGMMFESASQRTPVFEAKGIETVRRDQCSLTQKILRDALIKVFQRGINPTKDYLRLQWSKIHAGKFPVSDFVLTGRVRSRYRGGKIGPVQAALARRLGEVDPGRVVRHKERLPYVIVASPGKAFKLRDCVLTPLELLEQWDSFTIHSAYYVTKHVNASLQRCFGLAPFNMNVHSLYQACPKPRQKIHYWPLSRSGSSLMISSYFGSDICSICDQKCKSTGSSRVAVCPSCKKDFLNVACISIKRLNQAQQQASRIAAICSSCNGCHETSETYATEVWIPSSNKKIHSTFEGIAKQRRVGRLCIPIANCVCIDCPITYLRHELRESEIEASELMKAIL
eukprot:CCRYP_000678-RA/>CCRYP_000678-RA protein AED:0.04 eAED:0.04 QI:194/1/1/1/0.90/0.83/12/2203/2174